MDIQQQCHKTVHLSVDGCEFETTDIRLSKTLLILPLSTSLVAYLFFPRHEKLEV